VLDFSGLVLFGFWVYCIVDVVMSDASEVRMLTKWAWLAIVVLVFGPILPVGGGLWFGLARPGRGVDMGDRRERFAARPPRQSPRRARATPPEQPVGEAEIRARIEERDRLLRKWEEEERSKREPGAGTPGVSDA
jgi:hypothetical protein